MLYKYFRIFFANSRKFSKRNLSAIDISCEKWYDYKWSVRNAVL